MTERVRVLRSRCPSCRDELVHGHTRTDDYLESELCDEHLAMRRGLWAEWNAWKHYRAQSNPLDELPGSEAGPCDKKGSNVLTTLTTPDLYGTRPRLRVGKWMPSDRHSEGEEVVVQMPVRKKRVV